ncbi:MAG: ATP-dependent helicase, partial [Cellulosimicrobium sp.]|nr:ATP-dependent helicase [Cellulosimicrobium sp.]
MTADVVAPSHALDHSTDTSSDLTEQTRPEQTAPAGPVFSDLGLPAPLERAVADLGFVTPSAIQAEAIPALLAGRDITGVAQTGTGKTAAFGLPLLAAIEPAQRRVQAVVLTPTRELAMQVADAVESFAAHLPKVDVVAVYGGSPYQPQQRALAAGAQVVVGTPGRVIDHIERGTLVLDDVRFLVLDEADEMLRMGFAEDVDTIFSRAPRERQVALFSATMPAPIRRVANEHLTDPVEIAVARQSSTV